MSSLEPVDEPDLVLSYQLTGYAQPLHRAETLHPRPECHEVLLRVDASGVCHSDLHLYDGYFDLGDGHRLDLTKGRKLPLTLGHEIAGTVVATGTDATDVAVGDRRVVYPWIGCGDCETCTLGDEHVCATPRPLGVILAGGFADHVLVPHSRYLFDYGSVDVALACTYACSGLTAYSALAKTKSREHGDPQQLLIIGAGGVGFAALSLAEALVGSSLLVADVDDARLAAVRAYGVDETVNPAAPDAVKQVRRLTGGGVAAAIDFVGSAASSAFGVGVLAPGGTLVVVGLFGGGLKLSLPLLPLKQLTIRGSYTGSLPEMAALMTLVRSGHVRAIPIDRRPLSAVQAALDDLRAGSTIGRIVVSPHSV